MRRLSTSVFVLVVSLVGFAASSHAGADEVLYSIDRLAPVLHTIDASNGSTLASIAITLSGETIIGGTALATKPNNGRLYAMLELAPPSTQCLVTIAPATGIASCIGDPGDAFAALAFRTNGTLYAVTGDDSQDFEALYTMSTVDASTVLIRDLDNGNDGETLAFNGDDGQLYHGSGRGSVNKPSGQIFESIDPFDDYSITNVPLPDELAEVRGITWYPPSGKFLAVNAARGLYELATDGSFARRGDIDHTAAGLAWNGTTAGLYTVERDTAFFRKIDPDDGSTISSTPITLDGEVVFGGLGLALDPISGELFALLDSNGSEGRRLVTIDPTTAFATLKGDTSDFFAELAFDDVGTLYGVTGRGTLLLDSSTLYTLSTTDATPTFFLTLGAGIGGGESIAFNPLDGLLYHTPVNIVETIDLTTQAITPVATLIDITEWTALTHPSFSTDFFLADIRDNFYRMDGMGSYDLIGPLDHASAGLAQLPEPAATAVALTALATLLMLARGRGRVRY